MDSMGYVGRKIVEPGHDQQNGELLGGAPSVKTGKTVSSFGKTSWWHRKTDKTGDFKTALAWRKQTQSLKAWYLRKISDRLSLQDHTSHVSTPTAWRRRRPGLFWPSHLVCHLFKRNVERLIFTFLGFYVPARVFHCLFHFCWQM